MNSKYDELIIKKEQNIKNNYLTIKNVHIDKASYEAKILDEVDIENVMKYILTHEEGKEVLRYDMHNMISLNDYLKLNKLKKKDIVFIINNIYEMLASIDNYLLSENSVLLDTRTLMICKDDDMTTIKFCIIPCFESNFSYELSRLLVHLLRHIDTKDTDSLDLAYKLFVKSSKRNYSISDLMQVIEEVEVEENERRLEAEEYERELENERMMDRMPSGENMYYAYEDSINTDVIKSENDVKDKIEIVMESEPKKDEANVIDGIEIDEDTRKDLNISLFDKIDNDKKVDDNVHAINVVKKKKHKFFDRRLMVNANIKFHIAIFPILALLVPLFAYFVLGKSFFTSHYLLLVFYEVMIVLIISLNTLMDSVYKQC